DHLRRVDGAVGELRAGRAGDELPPLLGVLQGRATPGPAGLDEEQVLPDDPPGDRHEADLGPTGAEVDGEDELLVAVRPAIGGGHPALTRAGPSARRAARP